MRIGRKTVNKTIIIHRPAIVLRATTKWRCKEKSKSKSTKITRDFVLFYKQYTKKFSSFVTLADFEKGERKAR